jgi:hypothetical protein
MGKSRLPPFPLDLGGIESSASYSNPTMRPAAACPQRDMAAGARRKLRSERHGRRRKLLGEAPLRRIVCRLRRGTAVSAAPRHLRGSGELQAKGRWRRPGLGREQPNRAPRRRRMEGASPVAPAPRYLHTRASHGASASGHRSVRGGSSGPTWGERGGALRTEEEHMIAGRQRRRREGGCDEAVIWGGWAAEAP